MEKMKQWDKKWIMSLLVVALLSLTIQGCQRMEEKVGQSSLKDEEDEWIAVEITHPEMGSIEKIKSFTGLLVPAQQSMVIPSIPGFIKKIYIEVGQRVKKGDLLMKLDDKSFHAQLEQARTAYQAAKATVDFSRSRLKRLEDQKKKINEGLRKIEDALFFMEEKREEIRKKIVSPVTVFVDWMEGLNQGKVEPRVNSRALEDERKRLLEEKKMLEQMQQNIDNAMEMLPYDHQVLDAQLEQAQAGWEAAQQSQKNTEIPSPMEGVVGMIMVGEGEGVGQGTPLAAIVNLDFMILDIHLSYMELAKIKKGDKIKLQVEVSQDTPLQGEVEWISPVPDKTTGLYIGRVRVENPNGTMLPGMFAQGEMIVERKLDTIKIPMACLVREGEGTFIYIINDENRAYKRKVNTGILDKEMVEITDGIDGGERIVVKGQDFLKEGIRVKVVGGEE